MKKLFLLRHAHAAHAAESDFARPLSEAGEAEARVTAERLAALGFAPDVIVCSSAARARRTAEIVAEALGARPERLVAEAGLYSCYGDEMLALLRSYCETSACVLAVGHNPAVSECGALLGSSALLRPAEGLLFRDGGGGWSLVSKLTPYS